MSVVSFALDVQDSPRQLSVSLVASALFAVASGDRAAARATPGTQPSVSSILAQTGSSSASALLRLRLSEFQVFCIEMGCQHFGRE